MRRRRCAAPFPHAHHLRAAVVCKRHGAYTIDVKRDVRPVVDAEVDIAGCVTGSARPRPAKANSGHALDSGETICQPGGEGNSAVACGCGGSW